MRGESIFILGTGGHAAVIADILASNGDAPRGFLDDAPRDSLFQGLVVLRPEDVSEAEHLIIIAVGNNAVRRRLANRFSRFAIAIHKSAVIASDVQIGEGTVVMAGAVVNSGSRIGRHCIINSNCSVDHDCVVEDFASIAPGATLGGTVHVEAGAAVSIGATVIHGRRIGADSVVGAGSVVTHDVRAGVIAVGVPARSIRTRQPGDNYL